MAGAPLCVARRLRARCAGPGAAQGRSLCPPRAARAACPALAVEGGGALALAARLRRRLLRVPGCTAAVNARWHRRRHALCARPRVQRFRWARPSVWRAVCAPATVRSRGRRREFGANLTFASMGVAKTCGDGGTGGGREGTGRQSTGLDFVTGSLRGLLSPAGELYGPSSRRRARSRSPRGRVGATADDKTKQSDRFAHLSSHCCLGTCHVAVMCVASTSR